jgi:hypothetical protein
MTSKKSKQPRKKESLMSDEFIAMVAAEFEWEETIEKASMKDFKKGLKKGMKILRMVLKKKGIGASVISRITELPVDAKRYRYPARGHMGVVRSIGGTVESLL